MTSHLDILRTASVLVRHYGEDAALEAAQRAGAMLEKGCLDGQRAWKRAFGEKAVLKLMFAAMTRAAERWRAIKITDFERRQMAALRQELDQEYGAQTGLAKPTLKGASHIWCRRCQGRSGGVLSGSVLTGACVSPLARGLRL
jgi:hypothetical protein